MAVAAERLANKVSVSMDVSTEQKARKLSLLVMLLLGLHVLFGVTGIMGVLIAHTSRHKVANTPYESHLRWQIVTFWLALAGYAAAAWAWSRHDIVWPALLVAGFVAIRLLLNLRCWFARQPISRII